MSRRSGRNDQRERIAHLAARLMAEDGIEDYALAKRKAARQVGIADARQMPDNDQIDAALAVHRALFQQRHCETLRNLRCLALELMAEFERFNPHLTGSVLRGTAGEHAAIHLHLFTDDAKTVEHALLDRRIAYRCGETRFYAGAMPIDTTVLSFDRDGIEVQLALLSTRELHMQLTKSDGGRPLERIRRPALQAMLEAP